MAAKLKLKGFGGEALQGVDAAVQLDATPEKLTREDSRMMVTLKGLPDTLRGTVWPSTARAVRCPTNLGNGRDPHLYLQSVLRNRAL